MLPFLLVRLRQSGEWVTNMSAQPSVLVTGDLIIDRHIYEGHRLNLRDQLGRGTHVVEELGGAALTQRLISAVFAAEAAERGPRQGAAPDSATDAPESSPCRLGCQLSYDGLVSAKPEWLVATASWSAYPKAKSKDLFWRVSKALGYGSRRDDDSLGTATTSMLNAVGTLAPNDDVLVLDDAGDQFRKREQSACWHLPDSQVRLPSWIVLKLAGPIGRGDLWDRLMACEPRERLIVVVSSRLLRQDDVRLSRGLSWERTVEHLIDGLRNNPVLLPLQQARHVIVAFESDGAVWIDLSKPQAPAHLVFDAAGTEGEWSSRIEGEAFGYQTCLVAAVVHTLASARQAGAEPALQAALERGLSAMRNLREDGHGVAIAGLGAANAACQGFPDGRLARDILHPTHRFARATVPSQTANLSTWSILSTLQNPSTPSRPLFGLARQLSVQGDPVLDHVPHLRIGHLLTAGRDEMETLRSLRRIMIAYRDTNSGKKPLCIGVFGRPGSGKSFGVEQLAVGVFAPQDESSYAGWMEFNLSQFDSPADLIGAFHQVRDRVLQKLVPVVFWDEFDAQSHKWLQFLLAPMQDGRFQEGPVTHTLGKCVFVFAGGTAHTFEEFGPAEDAPTYAQFKVAKGPDFRSRLDGFLNVQGPDLTDDNDVFFPVRRAMMLRNLLGCAKGDRLEIDGGLLTALLEVEKYKHGARSLGKILEPLTVARRASHAPLRRSQLPAPNQLALHVDADQFHALCSRDSAFTTDGVVQTLAPAIHETWRAIARQEGWTPKYDMPFEQLPPDIKRSNDAAARRIPSILALFSMRVIPGIATPQEEEAVRRHLLLHLESMAEEEHRGWMSNAALEGWRFAEVRNDDKRLHNCLRAFNELSELDKEKDRSSVRHYPDFVRLAGFKIAFLGD